MAKLRRHCRTGAWREATRHGPAPEAPTRAEQVQDRAGQHGTCDTPFDVQNAKAKPVTTRSRGFDCSPFMWLTTGHGDDPVRIVAVPALCSCGTRPDPSPSAPRSECDTGSRGLGGRIRLAAWVHSDAGWARRLGGHPASHPAGEQLWNGLDCPAYRGSPAPWRDFAALSSPDRGSLADPAGL